MYMYAMHMLFANVYLDLTIVCVHVYVLCVFLLCVRVCECLYFILILPKGE